MIKLIQHVLQNGKCRYSTHVTKCICEIINTILIVQGDAIDLEGIDESLLRFLCDIIDQDDFLANSANYKCIV